MSKNSRCYVDFHVLQTFPPSCVNRDDTGSPKTAVYGGVTRARVSSQCWKRAIRIMFMDTLDKDDIGIRTRRAAGLIAEEIAKLDPHCDAQEKAKQMLKAKFGLRSKDEKTAELLFISRAQAEALARLVVEDKKSEEDKKGKKGKKDNGPYLKALNEIPSIDMAMFGRMLAKEPSVNYDASVQVAHSISTHAVHNEYDYFTAVDDLSPNDEPGAGYMDTTEFNSSTMYRYATIEVDKLAKYIGEDTGVAVRKFAEAFILSMPTGKQNTFANRTIPDMVYVTIREDQPVNLVGAFEEPISASPKGYVERSKEALARYAGQVYGIFVGKPKVAYVCGGGESIKELGRTVSLPEMLDMLERDVIGYLEGEGL